MLIKYVAYDVCFSMVACNFHTIVQGRYLTDFSSISISDLTYRYHVALHIKTSPNGNLVTRAVAGCQQNMSSLTKMAL
jgi:hypothetical protein